MSHQPANISAGTQVASRVEVRGANHSLVQPVAGVPAYSARRSLNRLLVRIRLKGLAAL